MEAYRTLLSPIQVGTLTLKNRLITTSMSPGLGYSSKECAATPRMLHYLEERAEGGVALICQSVFFYPRDEQGTRNYFPSAFDDSHIDNLKTMADVVHKHDSLLCGQLGFVHWWRRSPEEREKFWGVSNVKIHRSLPDFEIMSIEDIHLWQSQIANTARILKAAGWDAVELMAGVGGTLSRFMSPATNNRTDEYGGSVENRCRMVVETIEAVRRATGDDFPILIRWSPVEFIPGGNDIEDAKQIVPILEKAGVAWHNLQVGWHESSVPLTTKDVEDGHWAWISEELKKTATVPVVTGYRETDPDVMEQVLAAGKADIIGGLRYSIADPFFAKKLSEGKPQEVNRCICCCRCLDDVVSAGKPLEFCSVNPRLGAELDEAVEPVAPEKRKTVLVAGSGPAGLAAATTAADRGHKVILCERGPRVGGCLVMSSMFSPMYARLLDYYKGQLAKRPSIEVRLNCPVTPELVKQESPDSVIIATGGAPVDAHVPGADGKNVVSSHDFLEMLNGKPPKKPGIINKVMWNGGAWFLRFAYSTELVKKLMVMPWPFGKRVAVIGGGLPGCELSTLLIDKGRTVSIIEEKKKVGYNVGASERFHMTSHLKKSDATELLPLTKVSSITEKGVNVVREDGSGQFIPADTVAVTLGLASDTTLGEAIAEIVPDTIMVGDCHNPRLMADATKEGYRAAMSL